MVLVGIGGSGRRSLAKLASILSSVKFMGIDANKKYVLENFRYFYKIRADLFEMMFIAGTNKL